MNLVDFMSFVKRESGYGGSPVVTGAAAAADKPTTDILASLNLRSKRIWRKADWEWQREQLAIPMTVGEDTYEVVSASGNAIDRIYNLIPNDQTVQPPVSGLPLKQRTERQFYTEIRGQADVAPSLPVKYLNLGKDANGKWQVKLWPAPGQAFTLGGSAKGVLNTWLIGDVTGVAPFSAGNVAQAANPPLLYFPDGVVEDVLFDGVYSDILFIQKQYADAKELNSRFEEKLKLLVAEQAEAAKDQTPLTAPLPALVRRRRANLRSYRRC